ncbi:MAG: hypothetical protein WAU91_04960 [Desulfatitalea sp.]
MQPVAMNRKGWARFLRPAVFLAALWMVCGPQVGSADQLCVRSLAAAGSAVDGVVAPGEPTATCTPDPLWPQVGPAHMQPGGSGVEAYMYIARITGTQKLRIGIDTAGDPDVSDFDNVLLFFDADNSNTWNAGDFSLRVYVRERQSAAAITSGEDCNATTGDIEYWGYDGAIWDTNAAAAGQVIAKYAYDYSYPDAEGKIWNLEIEIPINASAPFKLNTTAPGYFALGAFLFADRGQTTPVDVAGQVRVWPGGLTYQGGGAPPSIGEFILPLTDLLPSAPALVDINLENVCFDVYLSGTNLPWFVNGAQVTDEHRDYINRNQVNNFRVTYYFDGPEGSLGVLREPNKGKVRLGIKPFNGGSPAADYWYETKTVTQPEFNRTYTVDFSYDFREAPDPDFNAPDADFICADAWLEEFVLNDGTDNDHAHMNLNYFATSEANVALRLYGSSLPKLKRGDIKKIYVQLETSNEHPKLRGAIVGPVDQGGTAAGDSFTSLASMLSAGRMFSWAWWMQMGVGLLVLLTAAYTLRRSASHRWLPRTAAVAGCLLLVGPMVIGCPEKVVKPDGETGRVETKIGTPRWQIENAKELGLTPVKGQTNLYELALNREQVKKLDLKFIGQPLPYKMAEHRLAAAVNGKPNKLDLPVKPGTVVSLLAKGDVDVDGKQGPLAPTTPAGFTRKVRSNLRRATTAAVEPLFFNAKQKVIGQRKPLADKRERYLLTEGYYAPNEHTGALIGSFDGFKTSFVVGRHNSIVVPVQATTLSLAVNATYQDFSVISGAYDVGVVVTEAPKVPTRTVNRGDATYNVPLTIPPWQVYVTLSVYTFYPEPIYRNNELVSVAMQPWGNAHFVIYDSHATEFTNIPTTQPVR